MQQVAAEMNLSETAFLQKAGRRLRLRWFTPKVEVDLCGHATLASAHVLWQEGHAPAGRDDSLPHPQRRPQGRPTAGVVIELDFPLNRQRNQRSAPLGLLEASGGLASMSVKAGSIIWSKWIRRARCGAWLRTSARLSTCRSVA